MARILVVEDEPELRELITEQLDDEGHQVFEGGNGLEGLDRLAEVTPDLIISDITMPSMNGYKFFRTLKENHPEHAHTPFVFLTALSDREDELKGLRMGVDAYITKPIDFDILTARVEGLLRIYRLQKNFDQPGEPAQGALLTEGQDRVEPAVRTEADPVSIGKISAIIEQNNGRVVAGKFQTVSLEKVRQRVGDQWQEVSDKILRNAEQVLRHHLGDADVFQITPAKDFNVCFAELTAEQAALKVDVICKEIWKRLFGETNDDHLSSVEGSAHELALDPDTLDKGDDIFSEVDAQISQQKQEVTSTTPKRIDQIYTYETLQFIKLLSSEGLPSKIDKLTFSKDLSDEIRNTFSSKSFGSQSLINIQKKFFENINKHANELGIFSKPAVIMSTDFSMIADDLSRKHYTSHCKTLEQAMQGALIIEITDIPQRFQSHIESLEPLPFGHRMQVLEMRTTKQVTGLDLKQLHCAIASMNYEYAQQHDGNELHAIRKELKRHGIKFYLKEIPDGALIKAQAMKADLYSMMR